MPLKGTTIEGVDIDVSAFKHEDTTVDFHINLSNIYGDPVRANSDHTFTAKVANSSGYIGDYPCAIDGTNLLIDSNEFFQLPPDSYSMEIWETWENDDGTQDTAIYPSPSKVLQFTINENIKDKTGEIVKRFDFQEAVENTVKSFLKNHPGSGDVGLRDYAKKSDIQRQLEDYAKKTELPKIIYDQDTKSLTINGTKIELPSNVDLSEYYTKVEVDDKLSKVTSSTVDGIITTDYGTFLQHDPNSVRVVNNTYSDGGDSFMLFDNGAEMHVANGQNIGAINGGWNANSDHIDQTVDHLRNKVAAYMRGDFPIVNGGSFDRLLVGTSSTSWINFAGTVVKNPYRDASKYIWGTAHFTNDESKVTAGERDMIKAWYQVGLFNDYEVVTYCHVVKKEAK